MITKERKENIEKLVKLVFGETAVIIEGPHNPIPCIQIWVYDQKDFFGANGRSAFFVRHENAYEMIEGFLIQATAKK